MIWQASTCAPLSDSPSCVQRSSTAYSSAPQRTTPTATPSTSTGSGELSLTASAPPMSIQRVLKGKRWAGSRPRTCACRRMASTSSSEHPGLQARGLGHHGLVPGGIEGQRHTRLAHSRDPLDLVAYVIDQNLAHAAPRGGEGDLHRHRAAAVLVLRHVACVHQTQVDDVDRDLRVVAGAHLLPGELAHILFGGVRRQLGRFDRLLADGVGVLAGDAEQIALEVHGEAPAEGLGDVTGLAGLELHLLAGRDDHRAHLAVDDKGLVLVSAHRRRYSVDTVAAPCSSAALSVCQQRLAHFTRAGNSRTPDSAASLPSAPSASVPERVSSACTLSNSSRIAVRSLPLTASVIRDAEAVEMAQPRPSKRMSAARSPSSTTNTDNRSPHSGLCPSARLSAGSMRPKFRGWRL